SGPEFEQTVKQAFSDALFRYCRLAEQDPRVNPRRLRIRIQVVTAAVAHGTLIPEIRALVNQTLYRALRGARLDSLAFPLGPALARYGRAAIPARHRAAAARTLPPPGRSLRPGGPAPPAGGSGGGVVHHPGAHLRHGGELAARAVRRGPLATARARSAGQPHG